MTAVSKQEKQGPHYEEISLKGPHYEEISLKGPHYEEISLKGPHYEELQMQNYPHYVEDIAYIRYIKEHSRIIHHSVLKSMHKLQ